jgi:hypothetical protein
MALAQQGEIVAKQTQVCGETSGKPNLISGDGHLAVLRK